MQLGFDVSRSRDEGYRQAVPEQSHFQDILRAVRERPRMFIPSDHYAAVVSFVQGLDSATDGWLLAGFNEWLAGGRRTSIGWWGQIHRSVVAQREERLEGVELRVGLLGLTSEESWTCTDMLFEQLDEFFAECPRPATPAS